MDIILHCLDPSQLKNKGLQDVFPAVCRFNQVSHCPATRRIAGKSSSGVFVLVKLVLFDSGFERGYFDVVRAETGQVYDDPRPRVSRDGGRLQSRRQILGQLRLRREQIVFLADQHRNVRLGSVADQVHKIVQHRPHSGRGSLESHEAGKTDLDKQQNGDSDVGRRFRDTFQCITGM
jgi:hypothetical protein